MFIIYYSSGDMYTLVSYRNDNVFRFARCLYIVSHCQSFLFFFCIVYISTFDSLDLS